VYDDYKFVTRQELEALGLSQYIGTNLLRAYMHGFFVDIRLYRKVSGRLSASVGLVVVLFGYCCHRFVYMTAAT
jgi:hypothetical protein